MKKLLLFFVSFSFSICLFAQSFSIEKVSVFSTEIYFDFGKDTIRTDADSVLMSLVQFCKTQPSFFIKITAHTDDVGSFENNFKLSKRRAEAVKYFLKEKEIKAGSLMVALFGEKQPAVSNRTNDGRQRNRRATIEVIKLKKMIPLKGIVRDQETNKGIVTDIIIRSKDSQDSIQSDEQGHFESIVPLGEVIGLDVWAKGYFIESKMFRATPKTVTDLEVHLPQIKEGRKVDIDNLYFVGNKDTLLKSSEPELPKILKFMQINENIKIEIAGHVNRPFHENVSKKSGEYKLSVRRALMVYEYLQENGVSEDRISYKGYGNWEMRYPEGRSFKQQQANRRVEIRVLEVGN